MQPADKVVERIINQIVSQEPGYQYFKIEPGKSLLFCSFAPFITHGMVTGKDITLVVNNLGGTSYLELYLIANSAVRYLSKEASFMLLLSLMVT